MENRYACAPEHVAGMGTGELRERFLVTDLFVDGEVRLVYSHQDRVILGGAVPGGAAGTLLLGVQRIQPTVQHRRCW